MLSFPLQYRDRALSLSQQLPADLFAVIKVLAAVHTDSINE
jgi:sensor domain CHASE-containing protein